MISLQQLKDLVAVAPDSAKQQPRFSKLEQAFAKTLASAFSKDGAKVLAKDGEELTTPAAAVPQQHVVNTDLAHQLMVNAAMQMMQGHVAVQAVNVASAVSLSAAAPTAKAPSFSTTDSGAIKVLADEHAGSSLDPADERLLAAFTETLAQQSTEAPHKTSTASATQQAPQVQPAELVQMVARHVSPDQPRVELILQPPELGRVHLNVEVRNNDVHVRVTADNHEVAKVLNDKLPQLEAALREQGLKVGSVSVAQQSGDAGMDTQTSDGRSRGAYDEAPEAIESIEDNPPKRQDARKKRALDVMA